MFKKKSGQKGFTLIELLVVIAIIGILSSVVLVSLQSSRAKARDAKRIADIGSIQQALALYYDSNNQYPATLHGLVTANLLSSDPVGPNTGETYSYSVASGGSDGSLSYHLGSTLEQVAVGSGVLASASKCNDGGATPTCKGFVAAGSAPFNGAQTAGTNCAGTVVGGTAVCYDVTP